MNQDGISPEDRDSGRKKDRTATRHPDVVPGGKIGSEEKGARRGRLIHRHRLCSEIHEVSVGWRAVKERKTSKDQGPSA
jgi:hypothetical protein